MPFDWVLFLLTLKKVSLQVLNTSPSQVAKKTRISISSNSSPDPKKLRNFSPMILGEFWKMFTPWVYRKKPSQIENNFQFYINQNFIIRNKTIYWKQCPTRILLYHPMLSLRNIFSTNGTLIFFIYAKKIDKRLYFLNLHGCTIQWVTKIQIYLKKI